MESSGLTQIKKITRSRHLLTILAILSITMIVIVDFRNILDYKMTGADSQSLIESSRILSPDDAIRVLTTITGTPPTGDTIFSSHFYRPVSALSYSLDYAIWGFNPLGYHITDMILHILVAVTAFFLFSALLGGRRLVAWVGAVFIAIHPIVMETITSPVRRQDVLPTLFILMSLLLFMKFRDCQEREADPNRLFLILSLFSFALALGSQEVAFIFPAILFSYLIIFKRSARYSRWQNVARALRSCLPYFCLTFAFFIFRMIVVHGLGGYGGRSMTVPRAIKTATQIIIEYNLDMFYPGGLAGIAMSPFPTVFQKVASAVILATMVVLVVYYRKKLSWLVGINGGRARRSLRVTIMFFAAMSLIAIALYPFAASLINGVVERAYNSDKFSGSPSSTWSINTLPLDYYLYKSKNLIIALLALLVFFAAPSAIIIRCWKQVRNFLSTTKGGKTASLMVVWILLPLCIYVPTLTYSHREMYFTIVAFSGFVSVAIFEVADLLIRKFRDADYSGSKGHLPRFWGVLASAVTFIIVLSLSFIPSALVAPASQEWKVSGEISDMVFEQMTMVVPEIPSDAVITFHGFPWDVYSYETEFARAKAASILDSYTVKSWLNMKYPGNNLSVKINDKLYLEKAPGEIKITAVRGEGNKVDLFLAYGD